MAMKQDDLTQLKHIGIARGKALNDQGITTIKQLHEIPLEKLAQLKSIGGHYANLIKEAVVEYYEKKGEKLPKMKTVSAKEEKIENINQNLRKHIKRLNKRLVRVNEDLKPLWKKKYLESYIEFKKRSNKLKARLNEMGQIRENLPRKAKKNIIKKTDALNLNLKKVSKKPKKKKYKEINQEIQSFSSMLRDIKS
jgi:nucleoside diphosphate kinase